MTIKATLQAVKVNAYGFASIKAGGAWYGADKKNFVPEAQESDVVEFEAFKNAKGYDSYKTQSFKKVAKLDGDSVASAPARSPVSGTGNVRDTYWADKAADDAKKDPRIVYQSSYERAILFTDLAIRNGAFEALAKAKATSKLEILESFVNDQAERIMKQVYLAAVPATQPAKPATAKESVAELESDPEESWA